MHVWWSAVKKADFDSLGLVAGCMDSAKLSWARTQVKKATTVIPRNSLIEANQSGLIAEPLIDITPQLPIPDYKASTHPVVTLMHGLCCLVHLQLQGRSPCQLAQSLANALPSGFKHGGQCKSG